MAESTETAGPRQFICRVLGHFRCEIDGEPVRFAYRQAEYVLAYLVFYGRSRRVDVARSIWPESSRDRALLSLRQALSQLRTNGESWVTADRDTIAVQPQVATDIHGIQEMLRHLKQTELLSTDDELRSKLSTSICEDWLVPWLDRPRAEWRKITERWIGRRELTPLVPPGVETARDLSPTVRALLELLSWMRLHSIADARDLVYRCQSLLPAIHAHDMIHHIEPLYADGKSIRPEDMAVLHALARAHYMIGAREQAANIYSQVADHSVRRSDWLGATMASASVAVMLREAGQPKSALRLMRNWLDRLPAKSHPMCQTYTWLQIGFAKAHMGDVADGLASIEAYAQSMRSSAPIITQVFMENNMAMLYLEHGRTSDAWHCYQVAVSHAEYVQDILGSLTIECLYAILSAASDPEFASTELARIRDEAVRLNYWHLATVSNDHLALTLASSSRPEESAGVVLRSESLRELQKVVPTPLELRIIRRTVSMIQEAVGMDRAQDLLSKAGHES